MQIHELNTFSGTLGAGAYLAIDDGTDTGKISSQGLLAATEARIDNIIAGPAPSAEEIVDARLGADGVTYPSLGDAIRDQITDVKSAITQLSNDVSIYERNIYTKVIDESVSEYSSDEINKFYDYNFVKDKTYRVVITCNEVLFGAVHSVRCWTATRRSTGSGYVVDRITDYTGAATGTVIDETFTATANAPDLVLRLNAQDSSVITDVSLEVYEVSHYSYKEVTDARLDELEKELAGKKWCAIGDSLTSASTLASETEKTNYVDQVCENLGLVATNLGAGGTGYINGGSQSNYFYTRIASIPQDTDIITVFGSLNDIGSWSAVGQLGDNTTDTLYGALQYFYNQLRASFPNTVVGVILPTPWINRSYRSNATNFTTYITALKDICRYNSLPVLNLTDESGMHPWDADFASIAYKDGDGVHPLSATHKKYITPKVCAFIKELI